MMHVVYKTVDTSRLSLATPTADPELTFPVNTGTYVVRGMLTFRSGTTADLLHGFSFGGSTVVYGSGTSWSFTSAYPDTAPAPAHIDSVSASFTGAMLMAGTSKRISMTTGAYWVTVGFSIMAQLSGVGQFSVMWSQLTSNGTDPAILLAKSVLTYEELL